MAGLLPLHLSVGGGGGWLGEVGIADPDIPAPFQPILPQPPKPIADPEDSPLRGDHALPNGGDAHGGLQAREQLRDAVLPPLCLNSGDRLGAILHEHSQWPAPVKRRGGGRGGGGHPKHPEGAPLAEANVGEWCVWMHWTSIREGHRPLVAQRQSQLPRDEHLHAANLVKLPVRPQPEGGAVGGVDAHDDKRLAVCARVTGYPRDLDGFPLHSRDWDLAGGLLGDGGGCAAGALFDGALEEVGRRGGALEGGPKVATALGAERGGDSPCHSSGEENGGRGGDFTADGQPRCATRTSGPRAGRGGLGSGWCRGAIAAGGVAGAARSAARGGADGDHLDRPQLHALHHRHRCCQRGRRRRHRCAHCRLTHALPRGDGFTCGGGLLLAPPGAALGGGGLPL
eukprot:Hpha_TRINITY_DN16399_c1_g1::TRINITY_DN16399_c1_g1_i2::g.58797::m.58797